MHELVAEYREFEEVMRENLEAQYQMLMIQGELDKAYETLGELMRFKGIEADDPRLTKNNKQFIAGGVDKDHRFCKDYRKGNQFMPDWLFANLGHNKIVKLYSVEHLGTRLENGYSGTTAFRSCDINIRMRLCDTPMEVNRAVTGIGTMYQEVTGRRANISNLKELCDNGVFRVYTLTVDGNCLPKYKNIGYAVVSVQKGKIHCKLYIKYEALDGLWLDIKKALDEFIKAFRDLAKCTTFSVAFKPDDSIRQQKMRFKDADPSAWRQEIQARAEAEQAAKEAAKAAKKVAKAAKG